MSDLETDALVLIDRLEVARSTGSTDDQLVDVVLRSGWRPLLMDRREEVLDGVLDSELHVPVRILHAS